MLQTSSKPLFQISIKKILMDALNVDKGLETRAPWTPSRWEFGPSSRDTNIVGPVGSKLFVKNWGFLDRPMEVDIVG